MTNVYCSWTPTTRGYHTIKNDFLNCAIPCQLAVCEITIYHSVGYLSLLFAVDFVLPLDVPMMSGWTIPQNCFQLDHHQYWQRRHEIFLEYLQTKHMQRGIWTIPQETTGDRVAWSGDGHMSPPFAIMPVDSLEGRLGRIVKYKVVIESTNIMLSCSLGPRLQDNSR